jgi:hypothetical protein
MNKELRLEILRKELAKETEFLSPLRKSINELEHSINCSRYKKYLGKYYIYENGNSMEKWKLYIKVIGISPNKNWPEIDILTAQTYSNAAEIKREATTGDHLFQKEITKKQFDKAYNKIKEEMSKRR